MASKEARPRHKKGIFVNLARILSESAVVFGEKAAVVFGGRTCSFLDIDRSVAQYAGLLKQREIGKGDRVAILLPKGMEFLFVHLATLALGAMTVPLNPAYTAEEVAYFLADSGAALLATERELFAKIEIPVRKMKNLQTIITSGGGQDGSPPLLSSAGKIEGRDPRDYPAGGDDGAMICYTSGTTGRSKGAVITHRNLISNMKALQETWCWTDADRLLHVLPMFHVHGLVVAMHGALHAGSTVVMHEKFDPVGTLKALEQEKITLFMAVPTIYHRLLHHWETVKPDLRGMRVFISGSGPLSEDLFRKFEETTGFRILERYGMTEAQMITSNPLNPGQRAPGSVGYPLPGVFLKILSTEGKAVVAGEVGEVWVKGDNVFKGYWNMPEKSAESFKEGWLQSGDLGYQDPDDGFRLYLVGRCKELIISGGYNVYPKEVESVLERHGAVDETAVFGLPDEDFGEMVSAAVVLKHGIPRLDHEELMVFSRKYLTGYKCPKKIFFLKSLPRNAMGKIEKEMLRKMFSP